MTSFARTINHGKVLVKDNSTAILTGVGVVGTVSTAVLTGRASIKAYQILENERETLDPKYDDYDVREKLGMVWPQFIPPVGVGVATITAILMANRISSREAAAMAAAYSLSERAFVEYKEKVVEKLGHGKETKLRDEIAQDRVRATADKQVVLVGDGEQLCFDTLTGRYFKNSMEGLRKAENDTNFHILNHLCASLSYYYDEVGLKAVDFSDQSGWNANNPLEVQYSAVLAEDGRPCIAIDFTNHPIPGFDRIY